MAVHRRRTRKPRAPSLARGTYRATLAGGDDLEAAAGVIADEARRLASWSRQIPDDITVEVSGTTATISTDVGPAYPNEVPGVKHPVFEVDGRSHGRWVLNEHRAFLAPAADAKASGAMERYMEKYDRLLAKAGFKPE